MALLLRSFPIPRAALATKYVGRALGHSHVFNGTYLTLPEYFPRLLEVSLSRFGCASIMVNEGHSGWTSAELLTAAKLFPTVLTGALGIMYAGNNDWNHLTTVQASPSPSSTVFAIGAGEGAVFKALSWVLVNGISRQILSVSTDTLTLVTALPGAPTAGQAVKQDTTQNMIDIGAAFTAAGYTRQIVCIQHYLNYSSLGDTLAAQEATAALTRTAERAAATAMGAQVADFYTFMRNRLVAGKDVQGDHAWHVADQNSHLNAYGQSLLQDCVMAAIPPAWLHAMRT